MIYKTFPLSRQVLSRFSISPDFEYLETNNARLLSSKLWRTPPAFSAGEIAAIGLIGKIYLRLFDTFLHPFSPTTLIGFNQILKKFLGSSRTKKEAIEIFTYYPPSGLHSQSNSIKEFIEQYQELADYKLTFLKNILLVALANENPALCQVDGVFSDSGLRETPLYAILWKILEVFFAEQPTYPTGGVSLLDLLREPAKAEPDSIRAQLLYILDNWNHLLGDDYINALLRSLDRLKEEDKPYNFGLLRFQDPLAHSLASYHSPEDMIKFSQDLDWMPSVVLIAKNVFVWLDQLSKQYQQSIYRLDHIPDEELEKLANWGFTGLWLIGIWQRSPASQKIKQICGNPDAVPSAYSLFDYTIADILGGDPAYENLSCRANSYGIRLAADMVPNHMGIYSKWVLENPDRFLHLPHKPYPNYSFSGPDLSEDSRMSVFIEDHYYDKSDAAVVFKRIDNQSGNVTFIYHGNDGTAMPWNDTAQLDFLQKEVREAVIQTIIHVASKFPIIRFDAAMTLAKKHYQRLWFPEPGTGGAIPTRSDFGLSKASYAKKMPVEFWQEVVDRIALEAPDTLLLAEAFWMMEGYFVRTLGMHRVYNSAFMHMLRDENNSEYRDLLKKTLEFDPEILKRYVNFMNNPDEETAISQFGSNGKYFGICVLLSTLPGLPMFGHGQIEGYEEKYGMEYQRAYYNETPDFNFIERHQREIFPLLHKRYLFSGVENFFMYDFITHSGALNEDVFAFSNRAGSDAALIIYHNKWGGTSGRVHHSVNINSKTPTLVENLGFDPKKPFVLFREHITSLEYIRSIPDLQNHGLGIDLGAYHYQIFLDFLAVDDPDNSYAQLHEELGGLGTDNLQDAYLEIRLSPLLIAVKDLSKELLGNFPPFPANSSVSSPPNYLGSLTAIFDSLQSLYQSADFPDDTYLDLTEIWLQGFAKYISIIDRNDQQAYLVNLSILIWGLFNGLSKSISSSELNCFLTILSRSLLPGSYESGPAIETIIKTINLLIKTSKDITSLSLSMSTISDFWFTNSDSRDFINSHDHDNISWFNQERFESLIEITLGFILLDKVQSRSYSKKQIDQHKVKLEKISQVFLSILDESEYQEISFKQLIVDKLDKTS